MRKRRWIFILATIVLLQACFPVAFAVSEKDMTISGISFCKSDTLHGGAGSPEIGNKLDYAFGKATGNQRNISRSVDMERQLNRIGIFDNADGRSYLTQQLQNAFTDPSNVIMQENGRILKESLLSGPNGVVKMNSIWEGNRLITIEIFGGGN